MKCLDEILFNEMVEEDSANIFHMDNSSIDTLSDFGEDEDFGNAILDDDEYSAYEDPDFDLNHEEED